MANEQPSGRSARPPGMIVTSITVVELPPVDGRTLRQRLVGIRAPARSRIAVAAPVGLAVLTAIAVIVLLSGPTGGAAGRPRAHEVPPGERAAIALALGYPYPLRCLTIAVSAAAPDYATANIDRTSACARYRGYLNASLHRIDGTWRLVLDEGQLFVPNSLLSPCGSRQAGCVSPARPERHRRPPR